MRARALAAKSRGMDKALFRPSTSMQGSFAFWQLPQAGTPPSHCKSSLESA
jgi:hypothetical protein